MSGLNMLVMMLFINMFLGSYMVFQVERTAQTGTRLFGLDVHVNPPQFSRLSMLYVVPC